MKRSAILLILFTLLSSACTSTRWVRTTVAEQYDFSVTLEQQEKKGQVVPKGYEHPYQIGIPALEKLMGDLKYDENRGLLRKQSQHPVFQTVEIERLAPALADALAKADAGQRVRFISLNQDKLLIFSVARKTEGVIFVEPGERLNMAFTFINSKRQADETTAMDTGYSSVNPLQIKDSTKSITATPPYIEVHKFEDGKPAPMWIVAALEKLEESTDSVIKATQEPPTVAPKDETIAPARNTFQSQKSEESIREDIRNKLKYLKDLRDEGLISEEDYTAKKNQLLDKIQ